MSGWCAADVQNLEVICWSVHVSSHSCKIKVASLLILLPCMIKSLVRLQVFFIKCAAMKFYVHNEWFISSA